MKQSPLAKKAKQCVEYGKRDIKWVLSKVNNKKSNIKFRQRRKKERKEGKSKKSVKNIVYMKPET